jgi:hypothetical protein
VRLLAGLAVLLWAAPLSAQRDRVQLNVEAVSGSPATVGASVTTENLLGDAKTRELLRNGFPARVHYRLELWRKGGLAGWSDERKGTAEWDVLVAYDPTLHLYNVVRRTADNRLHENFGGFSSVDAAEGQIGRAFRVGLAPDRSGKYYYNLVVDIQTLTVSDLDALEQWLRGPSAPTRSNPLKAIRGGVGTLLSRLLGGDKRHYEQRSGVFSAP